jgi:hypothetical protein
MSLAPPPFAPVTHPGRVALALLADVIREGEIRCQAKTRDFTLMAFVSDICILEAVDMKHQEGRDAATTPLA